MPRAAKIPFDDEAIFNAPYATSRKETIIKDPLVHGHRLTIKRRTKSFELQMERPRKYGPRRVYVLVTGNAPFDKIDAARKRAIEVATAIRDGKDPKESAELVTLATAWERFKERPMKPRTLRGYESLWKRCLVSLADTPLRTLSMQPGIAEKLHKKLTDEGSPVDANRAMQLLRAIYKEAASRDRSLIESNHPCTSIKFNKEDPAAEEKFMPPDEFPTWAKQLQKLRKTNPWRASYQMLLLRMGCRPNELQAAKWEHLDVDDYVLVVPDSKTLPYELPLCPQIVTEFKRLRKIVGVLHPGSEYVCPPSFATAKHPRYVEDKDVLAYSGSAGRTTHHSIGVALGVAESTLDVIEGRGLKNGGATAGRHYLARGALGPAAKAAQLRINNEIDNLLKKKQSKGKRA